MSSNKYIINSDLFIKNDIDAILKLIKEHTFANIIDEASNNNCLHLASFYGTIEIVKYLITLNVDLDSKNQFGETALHMAAYASHTSIAELLIDNGANIDSKNNYNDIPMHCLINHNTLQLFINKNSDINVQDHEGDTLLHMACKNCNIEIIKLLLSCNANINIKNNEGNTPLHIACYYEHINIIKIIINSSNDININSQNNSGNTLLHYACDSGNLNITKLLIEHNVDMNIKNTLGYTPLDEAITNNYTYIINALESYQAYTSLNKSIQSANNIKILNKKSKL